MIWYTAELLKIHTDKVYKVDIVGITIVDAYVQANNYAALNGSKLINVNLK